MAGGLDSTYDEDRERLELMQQLLDPVREGEQYVYFDGVFALATAPRLVFEGIYRRHSLSCVPQVEVLGHPRIRDEILSNVEYWCESAEDGFSFA